MKYIIIGAEFSTKPYCMEFDSDSEENALKKLNVPEYNRFYPNFIVNVASGKCFRVIRNWEEGESVYLPQLSAYDVVGIDTPDSYFLTEGATDDTIT
jgi:hypothetical protein